MRLIISNIGITSYQLTKYLTQLLSPLTRFRYSVNGSKDLIVETKNEKAPQNCNMVLFDVKSLFTFVPLEYTIYIIKTNFWRPWYYDIICIIWNKETLDLFTKYVNFSFNKEIYIQIDGVAMGFPLGLVTANIFMVKFKTTLVPKLEDHV